MKATAEIQAIPIGAGVSVRREVQRAHELLEDSGLIVETHASGTNVEGDLAQILQLLERVHAVLYAEGTVRLISVVKLETRTDKVPTLTGKRLWRQPSRGPKSRAVRPLRPRPRVAARLRASRPSRCQRAFPAPARGGKHEWRSARRRDGGPLSLG